MNFSVSIFSDLLKFFVIFDIFSLRLKNYYFNFYKISTIIIFLLKQFLPDPTIVSFRYQIYYRYTRTKKKKKLNQKGHNCRKMTEKFIKKLNISDNHIHSVNIVL